MTEGKAETPLSIGRKSQELSQIFITGVTGFMGRAVLRALLNEFPTAHIHAIVRAPKCGNPGARTELADLAAHPRVHLLAGDILENACGLNGKQRLPGRIDACLHLAASTEFKESSRTETFRVNVEGTRNLLNLISKQYPNAKLYHISTAYVCGYANGRSLETLLTAPAKGFLNPYEESKHAAELLVAASGLNWTILRPSVIVGHSETGHAESDKMTYGVLKCYRRFRDVLFNKYTPQQLFELRDQSFSIQGRDDISKNYICIDDVVSMLVEIMCRQPSSGTVFHLVNPEPSSTGVTHDVFCDVLGIECLTPRPAPPTTPRIEEKILARGTEAYRPYLLTEEPVFDQTQVRTLLGDAIVDSIKPVDDTMLRFLAKTWLDRNGVSESSAATATMPRIRRHELLRRFGGGMLGYSTLSNTSALQLPGKRGYVSYRVKGDTAVAVGDPVCADEDLDLAIATFLDFCRRYRYSAAAIQVGLATANALVAYGGHANRMGFEARLNLTAFDLKLPGKCYAELRKMRNLGERNDVTVIEATYRDIAKEKVKAISDSWLRSKLNARELGLLLRPLPADDEPDVRKFFGFIGTDLVGLVLFEPIYDKGQIVGYYANHERYLHKPGGIHDTILLSAMSQFRHEGYQHFFLGLAPLHRLEAGNHPSQSQSTQAILQSIRADSTGIYNFRGGAHHKQTYRPEWDAVHFWSFSDRPAEIILDIFAMIGLIPPEAVWALSSKSLELLEL